MGSANRPGNLFIPSGKADKITSPLMNFVDNYFEVLHCHLLTPFMASLLILLLFKLQTIDPEQHNKPLPAQPQVIPFKVHDMQLMKDLRQAELWFTLSSCSHVQVLHLHSGWLRCHPPSAAEMVTNIQQYCHNSLYDLGLTNSEGFHCLTPVIVLFIAIFNGLFAMCGLPHIPSDYTQYLITLLVGRRNH